MKRSLRIALTLALALAVSTAGAFATVVDANFNKINIDVNGTLTAVSGESFVRSTGDVPYSILYKGTTYLPLAKVCEFVGKAVRWDGETRTVYISNPDSPMDAPAASTAEPGEHQEVRIDATIDSLSIVVNGQIFARPGVPFDRGNGLQVPYSILYRGTTYLPLTAVCQIVGKDVSWDAETYTAGVTNQKELGVYTGTDVTNFGALCGLPKAPESGSDDLMIYNYYNYNDSSRLGSEKADLQKYVSYLFDAGYEFSAEDSRKLLGTKDTTLYAYRSAASGRNVVIGLVQADGLTEVVVSYTK